MVQSTGSVYLDGPRPSPRSPRSHRRTIRTGLAATLLLSGLSALTVFASLAALRVLLQDPDAVVTAIDTALEDPLVRAEVESEIAVAIEETLFGPELVATLAGYGIDVRAEAATIAPLVLDDPGFRSAVNDLVDTTHTRILFDADDRPLDMTDVTLAVRDVIAREIPEAEAVLAPQTSLYQVSAEQIPDLTGPVSLLERLTLATAAGSLLVPLAFAVHPRRHRVAAWVGRWLIAVGLVVAIVAVALPYLGGARTELVMAEAAIRNLSAQLLVPAAAGAAIGMGLVSVAALLKKHEDRATLDEGAAVALGCDDPLLDFARSQEMNLSRRGLVDVSHPLTNI